jgi:hypothetical protein
MAENELKSYLAEHPKMAGVLFTVLLLLSQAGQVAATSGTAGP